MRDFEKVITQIIDILGNNGLGECRLATELNRVRKSSRYTAPELMYIRWGEAHEMLCDAFLNRNGKIDNDTLAEMKLDILSIFSTKDKEELRVNIVE